MTKRKATSSTDGHERNWSELPPEILHLFSKKLSDISDFIRFRAVCKNWQLSAPINDPPPQLPWLLECRQEEQFENGIIRFYCLSSGKVHTITCPGSCRASLYGPACCYLLANHWRSPEMYLLNPLTHHQIHVPFSNIPGVYPEYVDPYSDGGNVVVMSGYGVVVNMQGDIPPDIMAFWQPEADDWVCVEGVGNLNVSANVFYMGQYFSDDEKTGITNVIDIATKKLAYQVAPPEGTNPLLEGHTFMVVSGGKILRLFEYYEAEQCHFDIYRLYFGDGEGKPCWVKITDIGDQMLFLQYDRGLSFRASNFAGFKGNCIYFLKDVGQYLCRYDIGDGTTEVLPCPFDSMQTWFVPSLV